MVQDWKLLTLFCIIVANTGLTAANEKLLVKHLMDDYDPGVRPVKNQTTVTIVQIIAILENLVEVIESSETIRVTLILNLFWTDEYLTWDPVEYDNITDILIPANRIWLPDYIILTSLEVVDLTPLESLRARVNYAGVVTTSKSQVIDNYCPMKIEQFPYDEQACTITITPWSTPYYWQDIQNLPTKVSLKGNSEWIPIAFDFERNEFLVDGGWTVIHSNYILRIRRKPAFFVWVLTVPTFITTALCITGIFTPTNTNGERAEKITIGLSTLLAVAVILNIASAEMPKGEGLPKLGTFVMIEMIICTVCLVIAVVIMQYHYRAMRQLSRPPYWLTVMLLLAKERTSSDEKRMFESPKLKRVYLPWKATANADSLGLGSMLMELKQSVSDIRSSLDRRESENELIDEWTAIFDRMDLMFFTLFQVGNVVVFITHLCM
uniref:Neurotransmitter-gated ion-channel ligand-binding domain-containing protein n=1 Tax=Plectus sambesii TaxID=2011161 RepID=A0A914VA97_9BILA